MRQQAAKELLAARYNKKVKSRELEEGDLRTKSPGARVKALKLPQRATHKVVGANTTAPHRIDHPVLSCKEISYAKPMV
ncbi:hypothetical protein PIB30_007987 [Stylosanthes scabra]|uniref:Uncharacterized protein n=1 Tax=Stylosanthes scabra TaxID=79078 RepID=A0ABU6U3S8_9FABA|nr:hypothetical protein [Stylosanthes scabra]